MRKISLSKTGFNKIRSRQFELKSSDLEDSLRSFTPGEWCWLIAGPDEHWISFVNPLVGDKFASVYVLERIPSTEAATFDIKNFITDRLKKAFQKRLKFTSYEEGCRCFYGMSDGLPGLIIDKYKNASVIQINTAGVDQFRDLVKSVTQSFWDTPGYLLDNARYREKEALPSFNEETLPDLQVVENGLTYHLSSNVIQKVGFYYDHRENRLQLQLLLGRINTKPQKGLDLFCYAGAWGLNALKAGVPSVEFVDQGNFSETVERALSENRFEGQGTFTRSDVFKFLDEKISSGTTYDLILSDPPAFAKSAHQKPQALEGYSKLHRKVLKIAAAGGICVFSSCTHYVTNEEFQKNIVEAANRENRKVQLLHVGIQGWDHPVSSLDDRSNYIKSFIYLLES